LNKEALKYLERVAKDFPDARDVKGKPLAREARSKLGAILHPVAVGKAAPEVEDEDADGKAFKLSDCKGKVVLLVFWGGWCGPSRAMLPSLGALGKKMEGKPFALVGVNSDRDRADLKRTLAREKIAWRSFWDGGSTQGPIATRWGVQGWPTIYLLDHEGVVRKKYLGNPGDAVLQEEVARLLKGAGPT